MSKAPLATPWFRSIVLRDLLCNFAPLSTAQNLESLAFVERTYGRRFVPGHRSAGMLGMLHAYTMDNVHGSSYARAAAVF